MKIKIIFDKEALSNNYYSGWGTAYLIDDKVLLDTAEKPEYLLSNLKALAVDINKIEKVVISHNHWDHRAGLKSLLKANKNMEVLACSDFLEEFGGQLSGYKSKVIEGPEEIANNIYTTGCLSILYKGSKIKEQALLVNSPKGISVIFGCAHPGVLTLIQKAKEIFPKSNLYCLIGGFHLIDEDKRAINYIVNELKKSGVEKVGPSHCTGFNALEIFKDAYGENFLEIKVGKEIEL